MFLCDGPTAGCRVLPNSVSVPETLHPPLLVFFPSLPPCASWSFNLPEVVVDGERVDADRHGLGGDDGELLAV